MTYLLGPVIMCACMLAGIFAALYGIQSVLYKILAVLIQIGQHQGATIEVEVDDDE